MQTLFCHFGNTEMQAKKSVSQCVYVCENQGSLKQVLGRPIHVYMVNKNLVPHQVNGSPSIRAFVAYET